MEIRDINININSLNSLSKLGISKPLDIDLDISVLFVDYIGEYLYKPQDINYSILNGMIMK
jgi:hypothetical protein